MSAPIHSHDPMEPFLPPRPLTAEETRLQRRRSNALGLTLGALAVIFFLVTILKMAAQIMLQSP